MNATRRLLEGAIIGCALVFISPMIAQAVTFAGTWAVSGRLGTTGSVSPVCVFRESGIAVSGTCKGPNGIGSALGAVRGTAIEWQWHVTRTDPQGYSGIVTFRGTLGADGVIRGSWTFAGEAAVGEFTAQRVR